MKSEYAAKLRVSKFKTKNTPGLDAAANWKVHFIRGFFKRGVKLLINIGMYINAIIFIGIVLFAFVGIYLLFVRNFFKD